jgi:hypothetical protein
VDGIKKKKNKNKNFSQSIEIDVVFDYTLGTKEN